MLDERQQILYTDTCNIYKPINLLDSTSIMPNNDVKGLRYSSSPTYTGVLWFHKTVGKLGKGKFYGRGSQETTTANTDRGAFDQIQDIDVNYMIQKTTVGDPDFGPWFLVEAKFDVNNFLANKKSVYLERTTKPPGVIT